MKSWEAVLGAPGSTPWWMPETGIAPMEFGIQVTVQGTVNYTVEYTYDDPNAPWSVSGPKVWPVSAGLTAQTADAEGELKRPIKAMRLTQNSGDGVTRIIVIQSGMPTVG